MKLLSVNRILIKKLNECAYFIPIFYRIRGHMNRETLISIFNTLYITKITYGISIYGATYKTALNIINKNIKYILRIILWKKRSDSVSGIMVDLSIRNLFQHYLISLGRIFRRILLEKWNNNEEQIMLELYHPKGPYEMRNNLKMLIQLPRYNNDYGKFKIVYRIVKFLNLVYVNGVNLLNLDRFRENRNKKIINNFIDSCLKEILLTFF